MTAHIFCGTDFVEPRYFEFLGGEAALFTSAPSENRGENEDSIGIFEWSRYTGVLGVADGVGGLPAGETASRKAIAMLEDPTGPQDSLKNRIHALNQELRFDGCGTTLAVFVIEDGKVTGYHAGDSIGIIIDQLGNVIKAMVPHSLIDKTISAGRSDVEHLLRPMRHLVTNVVGIATMWVETMSPITLEKGHSLVLASDGLWDNLSIPEVSEIACGVSVSFAAEMLLQAVKERMEGKDPNHPGKPDDLSFVIFRTL